MTLGSKDNVVKRDGACFVTGQAELMSHDLKNKSGTSKTIKKEVFLEVFWGFSGRFSGRASGIFLKGEGRRGVGRTFYCYKTAGKKLHLTIIMRLVIISAVISAIISKAAYTSPSTIMQ